MKQNTAENSLGAWFRRLFTGRSGVRPVAVAAPVAAPAQPQAPTAAESSPWSEYAPDFQPYASALGLAFQLPEPLREAQAEQVAQLSAAVSMCAKQDDGGPQSLPTNALKILSLVARTDVEVTELASAISQDPALTAATLRVANSAALGPITSEVATVRDAVIRLGVAESGRVAGAVAAKTLFSARSKSAQALFGKEYAELHLAAAGAAGGAAYLAMQRGNGRSDLAYLGGMLHDVGKSLALGALATLVHEGRAPRELEPRVLFEILETCHVELGAAAHERWALPSYLTALCAAHHDASVSDHPSQLELHLVRAVSGLAAVRMRPQPLERISELMQSVSVLGMRPLEVRALDAELRRRIQVLRGVLA
ncbi:MAG TPA: HDOD domain-containing protein [Polyangiales bacterium]|nr:HDOD domain-containing protein [Polyangiales bacterium]